MARCIIVSGVRHTVINQDFTTEPNNGIESDHAPIKKLVVAIGSFKLRNRAWSTIQRFESLRRLRSFSIIMSQ
ncbi:DDE-type integrase/transposase/recombinase [Aliivibrio sifiae]|uniref:DDE domain-containing protein n=1 Tax=Aliivibrio sifiae TaxID=566293 RepID=A0A2S7X1F8_9GAMM|nr:hypothetical protein BTO23_20790 [Aliivibrio sifiae]